VPQGDRLVYLQTPATIWDAEAVFFDEISRCRPELQNKLFPIVHERIVQGVPLDKLRYRWAAMNPPPSDEASTPAYAGSEPLDIALADRFAFVLEVPAFGDLSAADQAQVVRSAGAPDPDVRDRLAIAVRDAVARLATTGDTLATHVAEYVPLVAQKLAAAGHPLSTRRAVQLGRNIAAVAAAMHALGAVGKTDAPFWTALRHSIPDAAWGHPVPGAQLLAAHKAAWSLARLEDQPELKGCCRSATHQAHRPRARGPHGVSARGRKVVADSFAELSRVERLATARRSWPASARAPTSPPAASSSWRRPTPRSASTARASVIVSNGGNDWRRDLLSSHLATLDRGTLRGRVLTNAAIALMREQEQFAFHSLATAYDTAVACLTAGGTTTEESA